MDHMLHYIDAEPMLETIIDFSITAEYPQEIYLGLGRFAS
jgi:hypothetical protein